MSAPLRVLSVIAACGRNNCPASKKQELFGSTAGRLLAKMKLPAQLQGPGDASHSTCFS
jgi:hypothetical protein